MPQRTILMVYIITILQTKTLILMEADIMDLQARSLIKFFIIITFFFVSCEEKFVNLPKYDIDKITLKSKQGESFYNQKKFNGELFQTFLNNDSVLLGKYVNGKKDGKWKKFYERKA